MNRARSPARRDNAQPTARRMAAHAHDAARLLKALGNERRLMILCLLVDRPLTVGEINAELGMSQPALSQHLAVLRADGLVTTAREAQSIRYALADGPARQVLQTLHGVYCAAPPERRRRAGG